MILNRQQRRAMDATNRSRFGHEDMRRMPPESWPTPAPRGLIDAWVSVAFLAQVYAEDGALRISVCRTQLGPDGRWKADITWDELQGVKEAIGFGDVAAFEVYPAGKDVVNVANMRHLWIPTVPIDIGWRRP